MHQQRLESARGQAIRQRDRLNRRSADVQARDEPEDANGVGGMRGVAGHRIGGITVSSQMMAV